MNPERQKLPRPSTNVVLSDAPANDAPSELRDALAGRVAFAVSLAARDTLVAAMSNDTSAEPTVILPGGAELRPVRFAAALAVPTPEALDIVRRVSVECATTIARIARAVTPSRLRGAVLSRPSLGWRFPLAVVRDAAPSHYTHVAAWFDRPVQVPGVVQIPSEAGVLTESFILPKHSAAIYGAAGPPREACTVATLFIPWSRLEPQGITLRDVVEALQRADDAEAREASRVIQQTLRDLPETHAEQPEGRPVETEPHPYIRRALHAASLAAWQPEGVASVLFTLRELRDAHARSNAFAFPTTREANAATIAISAGSKGADCEYRNPATGERSRRRAIIRVQWEGKVLQTQLELAFNGDVSGEALAAVLDHMRDDGLRDWLALHAMADAQGRTGEVRWSWSEHKRIAGYDRRIASASRGEGDERMSDASARRAVIGRLWQLSRAALWEDFGNKLARAPIGGGPFVKLRAIGDSEGLDQERDDFTDALLRINPTLYRGAHRSTKRAERHFTGMSAAVFDLRGGALRLAVHVHRAERMHRDDGLRVRFTEDELMRYARVRGDGRPAPKHRAAARAELHGYVAEMVAAFGDGAELRPVEGADGLFDWRPARWRVEREQLGAAPERPALPPPADRPYDGAQLKAWRDGRGLSQRDAARVLKVGFRTVQRAELRPCEALPRAFARPGLPWHARGLPAGEDDASSAPAV